MNTNRLRATTETRFCATCGRDRRILIGNKIDSYFDTETSRVMKVYEAYCPEGHCFSPTLFGRSVIVV